VVLELDALVWPLKLLLEVECKRGVSLSVAHLSDLLGDHQCSPMAAQSARRLLKEVGIYLLGLELPQVSQTYLAAVAFQDEILEVRKPELLDDQSVEGPKDE
jgi:hypothetical protein